MCGSKLILNGVRQSLCVTDRQPTSPGRGTHHLDFAPTLKFIHPLAPGFFAHIPDRVNPRIWNYRLISNCHWISPIPRFCGNVFIVHITRYDFNTADSMKNPLQDQDYELLARQAWLMEPRELADEFARMANSGDEIAKRWMFRLYRYGMTPIWLSAVDKLVRRVDLVHNYRLNRETQTFELQLRPWGRISPVKDPSLFPHAEVVFGWILMRLVNAGLDEAVKRCAASDCRKYHFRRGKWCSDTCGSRMRLRKKRRIDKQRQML